MVVQFIIEASLMQNDPGAMLPQDTPLVALDFVLHAPILVRTEPRVSEAFSKSRTPDWLSMQR